MPRRYYSSTAVATTLSGSINNSTTSVTVTALSGFPNTTPWTAIIDKDTASEEVVTVTAVAGTTLTVTRGVDGTSAVSHNAGAAFSHGVSARDFDETNSHVNDTTTDVHSQYVLKSLVTTKGDLIVRDSSAPARLGVGANDTVLTADSSTATGLAWKAASGGISNTLLDAKGDLIAASANDTAARVAVGSNGQMLMADSSATAGLRYVDPPANRNLVINGAMQVAQRGTSSAGITGSGYFTADRWNCAFASLGTWTQSVETDAPTGSGFRKSLKMLCTTADASPAASDYGQIYYAMEGQDLQRIKKGTSSAEQLTLSFWVKSNVTGTFVAEMRDADNDRGVSATYTVSASATWEKKTITFPADTTGALDNDNAASMFFVFWMGVGTDFSSGTLATSWASRVNANRAVGQTNLAAATNNYWQITGVQLETGPVATPFEFEPYEATLRKCQRYYWRSGGEALYQMYGTGIFSGTTNAFVCVPFPVQMRAIPTVFEFSNVSLYDGNAQLALTSFTNNHNGKDFANMACGIASGGTQHRPAALNNNNNAAGFISFSAEL